MITDIYEKIMSDLEFDRDNLRKSGVDNPAF